jgi:hypothetical protein
MNNSRPLRASALSAVFLRLLFAPSTGLSSQSELNDAARQAYRAFKSGNTKRIYSLLSKKEAVFVIRQWVPEFKKKVNRTNETVTEFGFPKDDRFFWCEVNLELPGERFR